MERLARKSKSLDSYVLEDTSVVGCMNGVDKLGEYEDLEEQGLLLRLPCKVGDKAWYVNRDGINEVIVDSFVFNVNLFANVSVYIGAERFGKTLTPYKTLFFSKEEAEQKLKEMEGD